MKRTITLLSGLAMLALIGGTTAIQAQERQEMRFGFFGGANYNLVGAGAMNLARTTPEFDFIQNELNDGRGFGPYFGAIGEYTTGDVLGLALRLSVDQRGANLDDEEGNRFSAQMSYVTIEPGMRFNISSPFSITAGPALAVNLTGKYDYDPGDGDNLPEIEGQRINGVNDVAFGIWGDLNYDISLGNAGTRTPFYLTPFLGVSWLTDQRTTDYPDIQDERDDVWSTVSIRGGLQLKFGVIQ